MMNYRVIIIEQDESMLTRLSSVIKSATEFNLVASYRDIKSALGQAGMFRPNLFLVDLEQPQDLDLISRFTIIFPQANILGMLNKWDETIADCALEAGLQGCLIKPFEAKNVFEILALYEQRGAAKSARVMSFFSPKGRSGRTTLASIMAMEIA